MGEKQSAGKKKKSLEGKLKALEKRENYGILFADNNVIKYATLDSRKEVEKIYKIKEETYGYLQALLAAQDDIYFQNEKLEICSLFGSFQSIEREFITQSIIDFGGRILDAGCYRPYGLFETLTNKALITQDELDKRNYTGIASLCSFQNKLYALLPNNKNEHSFAELKENNGRYKIGDEIIHYNDIPNPHICQATILPELPSIIKGKKYDFSVLSCASSCYLDLNGKKIEGTEENFFYRLITEDKFIDMFATEDNFIYRFAILSSNSDRAEVIYAKNCEIKFADIDLNKKTAKTRKLIPTSKFDGGLDVVRNKELHNKLIRAGEELK
ncbi:hypothetical protein COV21_03360 [Candidatus Woesearchaeota archaeon CG10_big_fil_rev_8_21_14_0_10_45_5]|nr:MAG: hypothetical protein COV21_03360 [Candidatus Woesearchaeota archaeon CG10_big_fil_rev_8_21_14_0_10_45_5]